MDSAPRSISGEGKYELYSDQCDLFRDH